jgi:hypothetical protein
MDRLRYIFAIVFLSLFFLGTVAAYAVPPECPKQAAQKAEMPEHCKSEGKSSAAKKSPCKCVVTGCNVTASVCATWFKSSFIPGKHASFLPEDRFLQSLDLLPDTPPPRA